MSALIRLGESVFPVVLDAAWKATALMVVTFALARALGKKRPVARYSLWVYCLTGILILPLTSFLARDRRIPLLPPKQLVARHSHVTSREPGSGETEQPATEEKADWVKAGGLASSGLSDTENNNEAAITAFAVANDLPVEDIPAESLASMMDPDGRPRDVSPQGGAHSEVPATGAVERTVGGKLLEDTGLPRMTLSGDKDVVKAGSPFPWRGLLGLAWLAACGVFLARLLLAMVSVAQVRRSCSCVLDAALSELFDGAKKCAGVTRGVRLRVGEKVASPVALGVLRPTILLPRYLNREMPSEQLRPVLIHELAHVQLGDYAVNILQRLVECFFFFHPFVWLIGRGLHRLREEICDNWVLDHNQDDAAYARALTELAGRNLRPRLNRFASLGLFTHRARIRERIERILSSAKRPATVFRFKTALILLCASLAVVGSLSFVSLSARALGEATVEKKSEVPVIVEGDELTKVPFLKTTARYARYELPPLPVLLMSDGRAMVPAQRIWSDTGVKLREGQIVSVSAVGQVRGCNQPPTSWAFGPWGPEGTLCGEPEDADKKACALTGKIEGGGDQKEFYIGKELMFKAPIAGTFYLGVADSFHMDNEAAFIAEVKIDGEAVNFSTVFGSKPGSATESANPSSGETDAGSPSPGVPDRGSSSFDVSKLLAGKRGFRGTYNHRSRGQPYGTSEQWVAEDDQGALTVVTKLRSETYVATGDKNHRVIEYKILPEEESGYRLEMTIREGKVTYKQRMPGEEEKTFEIPVPEGSLFDPNTRPDPYCATVILLKHLNLKKGESKEVTAYDRDNAGVGMSTYTFRIQNRGQESVTVPAGNFAAKHLVLTQLTTGDTWYKKAAMHVTDFWVLDNGVIVKILRHREPYEVELQLVEEADPQFWLGRRLSGAESPPVEPPSKLEVTIPEQPQEAAGSPDYPVPERIEPEGGIRYAVRSGAIRDGQPPYTDRTYTLAGVPEKYRGLTYIQTANDDKVFHERFELTFEVNLPVKVYVAHDDRLEEKPSWLQEFEDTGDDIAADDPYRPLYSLYAKDYPRGKVVIGPNRGVPLPSRLGSMYFVVIERVAAVKEAQPAPALSPRREAAPPIPPAAPAPTPVREGYAKGIDGVTFMKTLPQYRRQELPPAPVLVMDDGRAMVPAQRIWSDTGVDIVEGQTIAISADGQVRGCHAPMGDWAMGPWGPEGTLAPGTPYQGNRVCALIGKIEGADKVEEFYIGKELTLKAALSGRLHLGVSDIFHIDNEGAFVVDVKIEGKRVDFGRAEVIIDVTKAGELLISGSQKSAEEVSELLQRVAKEQPDARVIVRAHREAPYKGVLKVLEACEKAGISSVSLTTTSVEPEIEKPQAPSPAPAGEIKRGPTLLRTFYHTGIVQSMAFSPDGKAILAGSGDGTVRLWDAGTGDEIRTFSGHVHEVHSVAFSPDGKQILTGSWDNTARLWNAATGDVIRTFSGHTDHVEQAAFSPDGKKALTASFDRTARLWEVATGDEICAFSGHADRLDWAAFSPDGEKVATGSYDGTAKLWDAATGKETRTFMGDAGAVHCTVFSPEGKYVLSGNHNGTADLWDAETGQRVQTFSGHGGPVFSAAFSPDGEAVLTSGGFDQTAKLWSTATGAEICTLAGHTGLIDSVALSPDGTMALTGSYDQTVKLWKIEAAPAPEVAVAPPPVPIGGRAEVPINLEPYVNAPLTGFHNNPGNDVTVPKGRQQLGDVSFQIGEGVIWLRGQDSQDAHRPDKVEGIKVGLKFAKLHFLHATCFDIADGTQVASYIVHHEDGTEAKIQVVFGVHLRDWWVHPGRRSDLSEGKIVWRGKNEYATGNWDIPICLYSSVWENPHPGKLVTTMDFVSAVTQCSPYVVAITAEMEGPTPAAEVTKVEKVEGGLDEKKGYERAFRDLYDELGRNYPAFGIKGIDWNKVGEELLPRAKEVKTDEDFGLLCMELVARLEDSHAYLMNGTAQVPAVEFPRYDPGFACLIDDRGKPVVYCVDKGGPADTAGVRVGMTVVSINGEDAGEHMQRRMKETKKYSGYSSDRYLLYHAAQWLGRQIERGAEVEMEMQDVEGKTHRFKCPATYDVRYLPRLPVPTPGISDSANVSWVMLEDNIGLIYVRRIGDDLIPRLDQAVGALKNARGLIVDVRGNSGGGFDASRALRNFSLDDSPEPQRPRFKGPIALLTDARCISAGEGWASWFIANKRAKVFGETTAGASSRKTVYTLTNGLFKVQYAVKAYTGFLDRPIEQRGLEPDVSVKQNANDLVAGRDTVLEAAKQYLLERTPGHTAPVAPAATEAASAGAEAKAEEYSPPDYVGYFPDDPEGGRKLDAMSEDGIFQSSLPDDELLEIVRKGLRRTTQRWILRALGNRYIWGKYPQNPKAIEIMYHATDGPDMSNAVYFGLSVVLDKSPSILRALVDICMRSDDPNVLSRVAWGTQSQTSEILPYLTPYLNSGDEKTQEKARIVEKILTGELKAFAWSAEKARVRAEAFRDRLPEIKEKLLNGDSATRREALNFIATTGITLIMDDSFIEAWKACGTDPDARIRNDVARTFGNRWIWGAAEQKPEAIELMLQLSRDEVRQVRYNSVYFGLSTVRDKSEAVVTRLLEIGMDDREWNMFQRIQWGLGDSKALAGKILEGYMDQNDSDPRRARAAFEIYKDIVGANPPRPERFQK